MADETQISEETRRWPAHYRSALSILIDAQGPETDPGAWYAPTGLDRLLRVLADLDIHATVVWTAEAALARHDQLERARAMGHSTALTILDISDPQRFTAALNDLATRHSGPAPGIVLPDLPATAASRMDAFALTLHETGFPWIADDAVAADLPLVARRDDARVVRLPLPPRPSDIGVDVFLVSDQLVVNWRDDLDVLRDEGNLQVLRLTAWRSGRPGVARGITRFFDYAIDLGDVWIAPAGEIATWWTSPRESEDDTIS